MRAIAASASIVPDLDLVERGFAGFDIDPGLTCEGSEIHHRRLADRLALPGERQQVVDEFVHPVGRGLRRLEV